MAGKGNDTEDKNTMMSNVSHSELRQNRVLLSNRGRVLLVLWRMHSRACMLVCVACARARLRAFVRVVEWVALQQAAKPLHQHLLSSDQLA